MKESRRSSLSILRKSVLTYHQAVLAFFVSFVFSLWVFFQEYHDSQDSRGEGGGYLFIIFLPLPAVLLTYRH